MVCVLLISGEDLKVWKHGDQFHQFLISLIKPSSARLQLGPIKPSFQHHVPIRLPVLLTTSAIWVKQ